MASASENLRVGSTFVRETMPRFLLDPGRIITVSKVPSMFLNRFIVSRRVLSPIDVRMVSEAIPTVTPAIIKAARALLRDGVRTTDRRKCRIFMRTPQTRAGHRLGSGALCVHVLRLHHH